MNINLQKPLLQQNPQSLYKNPKIPRASSSLKSSLVIFFLQLTALKSKSKTLLSVIKNLTIPTLPYTIWPSLINYPQSLETIFLLTNPPEQTLRGPQLLQKDPLKIPIAVLVIVVTAVVIVLQIPSQILQPLQLFQSRLCTRILQFLARNIRREDDLQIRPFHLLQRKNSQVQQESIDQIVHLLRQLSRM